MLAATSSRVQLSPVRSLEDMGGGALASRLGTGGFNLSAGFWKLNQKCTSEGSCTKKLHPMFLVFVRAEASK